MKYKEVIKINVTRERNTAYNSVLPQLAVTRKIEAECYYQTLVQDDSEVLRIRQRQQHAKRQAPISHEKVY